MLEDVDGARAVIEALAKAQISLYDVTEELVADGVKSFADSFNAMLDAIKARSRSCAAARRRASRSRAPATRHGAADAALDRLVQSDFLHKLWTHDPRRGRRTPAHVEIIKHALGWVEIAQQTHAQTRRAA